MASKHSIETLRKNYLSPSMSLSYDEPLHIVRGEGLFLGIEFVKNKKTLLPLKENTSYLVNEMKNNGILLSSDGPNHNVIKIKPPMVFSSENASFLVDKLDSILKKI